MAWLAVAVYLVGIVVVFGMRSWLQYRTTGDTGHRHTRPAAGTAAWWAQVSLASAILLGLAGPLLAALEVVPPVSLPSQRAVAVAGLLVAVAGLAGVLVTQQAMGRSWRVGVDADERTELVTGGVFRVVRNPVFTAMIAASVGLTAVVSSWLQVLALAALIGGVELQVRAVEEPYLTRLHGSTYTRYTAGVGRFLPGIGRTHTQEADVR